MNGKRSIAVAAAGVGAGLLVREVLRRRAPIDLSGKVVLISGGERDPGLTLAREFAALGARIAICAHDAADLDHARQEMESCGARIFGVRCDVTNLAEVDGMVGSVLDHYGAIDILVNCAGGIRSGPAPEMALAEFEHAMDVMFWGLIYPTRAVLPHMLERGEGRIVNITSVGEESAARNVLPYDCAKSAAIGFSEGLRTELAREGISVVTIVPGQMPGARQIVNATRRGEVEFSPVHFLQRVHRIFAGAGSEIFDLVERLILPPPRNGQEKNGNGTTPARPGRSPLLTALTFLGRAAAHRYLNSGK
jgi:NAD(P)-dependent dehydrogenase (short-subunit alcohol dehydrogenase family)